MRFSVGSNDQPRLRAVAVAAMLLHLVLTLSLVPLARQLGDHLHPDRLWALLQMMGLILGVYGLKGLLLWIQTLIWHDLALKETLHRRQRIYATLLQQPFWRWSQWQDGDLLARLTEDLQQIETTRSAQLSQLIPNLLLLGALLITLFWINPLLSVMSLCLLPLGSRLMWLTGSPLNHWSQRHLQERGQLHQALAETLRVLPGLQSLRVQDWFQQRLEQIQQALRHARLRQIGWQAAQAPLLSVVQATAIALIILTGLWQMRTQALSQGDLMAFATALALGIDPGLALAQVWGLLRVTQAAEARVAALENWPSVDPTPHPLGLYPLQIKNLSFGWTPQSVLFTELSLTLMAGEYCALTGDSGCGKSTLLALIAGQLEAPVGTISSSGSILLIPQKTHFLNQSLADNLYLGRSVAASDLQRVLQVCQLEQVIEKLPAGLASPMGNQGSLFSGGERQRIALARALLGGAPALLLLDEATSELDLATEARLLAGLRRAWPHMACLHITHRPESLTQNDRYLLLQHGKLRAGSSRKG